MERLDMITAEEFASVTFRCEGLRSIAHVYEEVKAIRPESDGTALRCLFLGFLRELLSHGRIRFLGETWIRDGAGPDAPYMFGERAFDDDDVVIDGLRQPTDPSPEGVVRLIEAKWPTPIAPAFNVKHRGFDPIWFEKWNFVWRDPADSKA